MSAQPEARTEPRHRALRVRCIGALARGAVASSGRRLHRLPGYGRSPYWLAGDTVVWIGTSIASMHPRAIVVAACGDDEGPVLAPDLPAAWQPAERRPGLPSKRAVDVLLAEAASLSRPRGFAACLLGKQAEPLLRDAIAAANRFAMACAADRVPAALREAEALLGVGPGLTPSGDDFVGGGIFTRMLIAPPDARARWQSLAGAFVELAHRRSHFLGAVLFSDLVHARSFEALHRMVCVLQAGDLARLHDCVAEVLRIGHSSGWDLLAGCVAAVRGHLEPCSWTFPQDETCPLP